MQRYPDWPERLAEYVADGAHVRFRWGVADCCLWACSGVEAMTGVDPAAQLRETYCDRDGAKRALRRFGGQGLLETIEKIARQHEAVRLASPLYAQRGDVVLADGPGDCPDALGLCVGSTALFLTPRGLRSVHLKNALAAWRV